MDRRRQAAQVVVKVPSRTTLVGVGADARRHMKDLGHEFKAGPTYAKHTPMGKVCAPAKAAAYLKSCAISKA